MQDNTAISTLQDVLAGRDRSLHEETARLVQTAERLLWHTLSTFPSGTSHTPEHTSAVERIAFMAIPEAVLDQLNDDELQLLILGCHFHDLGMAGTEAENSSQQAQEQARRDHAIRIGDRLKVEWQQLGFRDLALADALAEVCRGHRPPKIDGVASWESIRKTAILGPDRTVRLRIVSALVYVADELHIGADRATTKEEQWLQIRDDESRRHWKRHQLINGPALIDGHLEFEVAPPTTVLESDLREQVLQKALTALMDGQSLLQSEGILHNLPPVSISWNRSSLWSLLLICDLADLKPRSRNQICDLIYQRYSAAASDFCKLPTLEDDAGNIQQKLLSSIDRVVSDYFCRGFLHATDDTESELLRLNTELAAANVFFEMAKNADEMDVLFSGRYAAHYDFNLQSAEYGIKHTELSVVPLVRASYGIIAPAEGETPATILLKSSPTARHLAIEGAPAPGVLSKPFALALAVFSGASLDLLRSPELMLRKEFRHAYRALASFVTDEQSGFIRLVEELALVDGYSFEQLSKAMTPSAEAVSAFDESIARDGSSTVGQTSLKITQQIPTKLRPIAVSLPHLFLAGQRAKTTVQIVNTEEAPIVVKNSSNVEDESQEQLTALAFTPSEGRIPPTFALRADFDVNEEKRQLQITLCPRAPVLNHEAPLLMRLNTSEFILSERTNINFSFYSPALTARHWHCLASLRNLSESGNVSVVIDAEDGIGLGTCTEPLGPEKLKTWLVEIADPKFSDFLYSKGLSTPNPDWCPNDVQEAIETRKIDEWNAVYAKYGQLDLEQKSKVSTITLRMAHQDGREYKEEFLGFFPNFDMGPPQVDDTSTKSQAEIDELWEDPKQIFMVGGSYSSDEHELALLIRNWADDPSEPFPLGISGDPPDTPVFRSRFEIVRCPKIDRFWYVERPYILRFRPVNDEEMWNVEGHYWESKGDQGRAAIISERLSAMRAAEEGNKKDTTTQQPTESGLQTAKGKHAKKSAKKRVARNKKKEKRKNNKSKKWKKRK